MAIDPVFLASCRPAIQVMRDAHMNEVLIADVITQIRSAALAAEALRQEAIRSANVWKHIPWSEIKDAIAEKG